MKSLLIDGQEVKTLSINNKIVWKKSSGWMGLKFTAEEPNCSMYFSSSKEEIIPIRLEYSLDDGLTWQTYSNAYVISLDNIGDSVCFRCSIFGQPIYDGGTAYDAKFYIINSKIRSSGNIMSIKYNDDFDEKTTVGSHYFRGVFKGCTSLTTPPELPATTLGEYCYGYMFDGCTSLTTAPELPATTLANDCYSYMFQNCTSLTKVPSVLPATTLHYYCYYNMFYNCTSLNQAPELPAKTLVNYCYSSMFQNCTSLKRIKMNSSSGSWGTYMFNGCTSLELVDMTGSTGVPTLSNVNNFDNTNDTYKVVVPDSLYDTWIAATNWASIASHIMKQSDWNTAHPDDILGQ